MIGLLPKHFNEMLFRDYLLLKKGFYRKMEFDQIPIRRATWLICAHFVGGKNMPPIDRFWPSDLDKEFKELRNDYLEENTRRVLQEHREKKIEYVLINGRVQKQILN